MDALVGIAAILIGLIFGGFGAYRMLTIAETVKRLKVDSEALYNQAHAEVLQLEAQAETIQKKVDERKATEKELSERHKEGLSLLSPQTREKRAGIWIASNRRAKGDVEFHATVFCARLGGDWNKGRDYVLWAKDEDHARRAFDGKFPPSSGYEIESLKRSQGSL